MSLEEKIEQYLAKAREAEAEAAKTLDHHLRESWLRIAQSYRAMAQQRLDAAGGIPRPSAPAVKAAPHDDGAS